MVVDYLFPGSVVILKFLFKLLIGRSVTAVDFFRAVLSFPIDLAFLALSFAAIVLSFLQAREKIAIEPKQSLGCFVFCIAVCAVVAILVRKSESKFDQDSNLKCVAWITLAYMLSGCLLAFIFLVGGS
ncbi:MULTISPECIES: hypothetical protein [unclassified Bradyrhizobium]|uniref:hypothetical protein n=1 Tax=unclassified Bradyrhizobium TaxID=2631580 RepID=UPI0024E16B8F|nr:MULTISPECIES: hypothetical protein [unclassified Bradyrhizobium]